MTTPVREERCERCRYWERLEDDVLDIGACHCWPPTLPAITISECNATWPETLAAEWCGEWQPRDEAKA